MVRINPEKKPSGGDSFTSLLTGLREEQFSPLDLLPRGALVEKIIELTLSGPPVHSEGVSSGLKTLAGALEELNTSELKVVVFGGGSGLSNLVGGDSRRTSWPAAPFHGLKELFPQTRSVVCITDDGGSTGELLKDLALIAIGDLRHVLLSSITKERLKSRYRISAQRCLDTAAILHRIFNYRFSSRPADPDGLLSAAGVKLKRLPAPLARGLGEILDTLFNTPRLSKLLDRPHCLGNLLMVAEIHRADGANDDFDTNQAALIAGIQSLAELIGAAPQAVLPCSVTPAHLKVLYSNGVLASGEHKAGAARRDCPVDRVFVESCRQPRVPKAVLAQIREAEIILFAPGSLYTSIIPILQLRDISSAVRENHQALKMLVANIWAQTGETDLAAGSPARKFYVSDLIQAYNRNIPGGTGGIFNQIMVLGLKDIPGSILQNYAMEDKVPIYLDRERVSSLGFVPIECRIFSPSALAEQQMVQHDPYAMARAIRAVWAARAVIPAGNNQPVPAVGGATVKKCPGGTDSSNRFKLIEQKLAGLQMTAPIRRRFTDILWKHRDILLDHLANLTGIQLINPTDWRHSQEWDRIFAYYDPKTRRIKIREDIFEQENRFELAVLVSLGESLLGDYASKKIMRPVESPPHGRIGRRYEIILSPTDRRHCFLNTADLHNYLNLARMNQSTSDPLRYIRLINGSEGFTPPGLLFGLVYAWYLDNRFAAHIEYKMSILQMEVPDMITEQVKVRERRRRLVDFFRKVVFGYDSSTFGNPTGNQTRSR